MFYGLFKNLTTQNILKRNSKLFMGKLRKENGKLQVSSKKYDPRSVDT